MTLCLVLAGCAAVPGKDEKVADEEAQIASFAALMTAGDEAYAQTDLDTAQVKYALAVNQNPTDVAALYKLGMVHYQKKSLEVAEEVLLRVVASEGKPVLNYKASALERLGLIAILREDLDLATTRFNGALQQQPGRWRSLNGLGIVGDMQARHADAQENFRKALALSPGNAQIENNLGYSHYLQGDYVQAQRHFLNATQLNPDYKKAWSNLGLSLVRQSRYEEARSVFARLAKAHVVSNNLGYLGMLQGDYEMAQTELTASQQQASSYYSVASENLELLRQRSGQQHDLERLLPARTVSTPDTVKQANAVSGVTPGESALVIVPASAQIPESAPQSAIKRLPKTDIAPTPVLKPVASKTQVKTKRKWISASLFHQLVFLGYLDANTNQPVSASATEQAMRSLQVNHNLELTGRTNAATQKLLKKLVVERVQAFLSSLGYASTDNAGVYGLATREVIRQYKRQQSFAGGARITNEFLRSLREHFS